MNFMCLFQFLWIVLGAHTATQPLVENVGHVPEEATVRIEIAVNVHSVQKDKLRFLRDLSIRFIVMSVRNNTYFFSHCGYLNQLGPPSRFRAPWPYFL